MSQKILVFEGCDGSGKSTLIKMLVENNSNSGVAVIKPRLNSEDLIGRDSYDKQMAVIKPLLRNAYIEILHHIQRGIKLIICDRLDLSAIAYQGILYTNQMNLNFRLKQSVFIEEAKAIYNEITDYVLDIKRLLPAEITYVILRSNPHYISDSTAIDLYNIFQTKSYRKIMNLVERNYNTLREYKEVFRGIKIL
jgi:hypothetical protein